MSNSDTDAALPKLSTRDMLAPVRAIYRDYWKAARGTLILVALAVIVSSVAGIGAPYLFSRLIDEMRPGQWVEWLLAGFIAYGVLLGASNAITQIVQNLAIIAAEQFNFIAATAFFQRLLKKTIAFFIDNNPAAIQSAQSRGSNSIYFIVQMGLIALLPGTLQIVLAILLLGASINFEIALIVFGYGALHIGLTYLGGRWVRSHLEGGIAADQENAAFVGNSVNAMKTLRYFGSEDWMVRTFTEKVRRVGTHWRGYAVRRIVIVSIVGILLAVQFALTFALLLPRYRAGEISVGDIVLFNALLLQLNQPFEMIGTMIDQLMRSWAGFMPFARMWAAPEEPDAAAHTRLNLGEGTIMFDRVGFAYREAPGLINVSFTARRGRINFLVGETGAGKTTLFKLALKSLEPQSGRISVDGRDLGGVARTDWYGVIGVVPQEIMLLNESLEHNIVLGRLLDPERLERAARRASIHDFIASQPEGYATIVGERGLRLSGGERQRIAIARALYADPAVMFLDEASSALDEGTETEIMAEIRNLADEMTILAITHRKTVIAPGDAVIELKPSGVEETIAG
ncbi:MAG: ABC transporter ATP-binding protein [Devosia sp.]